MSSRLTRALVHANRTQFGYFIALYLFFSFHPLPNLEERLNRSRFSMWTYKYFSYRLMWSGDAMEKIQVTGSASRVAGFRPSARGHIASLIPH